MSDQHDQPGGGYDPADPWAPPNRDGVELSKPVPPVYDQPTVTSMPAAPGPGGDVPPPPVAPGGPASAPGAYGYPADPSGGYGYPPAPTPMTTSGYGYPGYPGYGGPGGPGGPGGWSQSPSNGLGTAAMVLGIIAVAGFCMYGLGVVLGILALIFGIIGLKKANRGEATNRGMAISGIVLGAVGTVISAVFLGFFIWAIAHETSEIEDSGGTDDPYGSSLVLEVTR